MYDFFFSALYKSLDILFFKEFYRIVFPGCIFSLVQSLSHVQPLCDPMNCSMPGFCVCHQLPELAQRIGIH